MAIAFINAGVVLESNIQQNSREWPSNKSSKLFFTGFNARVGLQPRWGANRPIKACHEFFVHNFRFSKHVMLIYVLCENPLNKKLATCIVN